MKQPTHSSQNAPHHAKSPRVQSSQTLPSSIEEGVESKGNGAVQAKNCTRNAKVMQWHQRIVLYRAYNR